MVRRGSALGLGLALFLACCAPQLVPGYDEPIDTAAQNLRADFLKFVAERQRLMGQPTGNYASNAAAYSDFLARLGAIELRAADQPVSVDCAQLQGVFARLHTGEAGLDAGAERAAGAAAAGGGSCIVALARLAAGQVARLQADDARRCAAVPPGASCVDLFGTESVGAMVAAVHTVPSAGSAVLAGGTAPLVRATLVSLDELAGAEQDLKAAAGK